MVDKKISKEEKWKFVENKECPYCFYDLGYDKGLERKNEVVTGCPYCHRSFVD